MMFQTTPPARRCLYVWHGEDGQWVRVRPPAVQADGGDLDNASQVTWLLLLRRNYEEDGYTAVFGDLAIGAPEGPPGYEALR